MDVFCPAWGGGKEEEEPEAAGAGVQFVLLLFWRAGTTPIKKKIREFGLKFWRPTNSESRSESCSENRAFT